MIQSARQWIFLSLLTLASALLVLALLPTGCLSGQNHDAAADGVAANVKFLPTTTMKLGSKQFTLEIANSEETRETGLMYRDSMPADHGMIFVFQSPQFVNFYMKNTRIPLDIVFVDPNGVVVSVNHHRQRARRRLGHRAKSKRRLRRRRQARRSIIHPRRCEMTAPRACARRSIRISRIGSIEAARHAGAESSYSTAEGGESS